MSVVGSRISFVSFVGLMISFRVALRFEDEASYDR